MSKHIPGPLAEIYIFPFFKFANNQNRKGKNNKSGLTYFWCCGIEVYGGICGNDAMGQDHNYGI